MSLKIVGGLFKGRLLKSPPSSSTRPTQSVVREAVFNICQSYITDATFLDCFAGSGAMAFEAISRGAAHATLIEENRQAIKVIKENIEILGVSKQIELLPYKAEIALKKIVNPFDIIYIDPPYEMNPVPFIEEILKAKLLKDGGILFLEERSRHQKEGPEIPFLKLKSSRKFGEALLHTYQKN